MSTGTGFGSTSPATTHCSRSRPQLLGFRLHQDSRVPCRPSSRLGACHLPAKSAVFPPAWGTQRGTLRPCRTRRTDMRSNARHSRAARWRHWPRSPPVVESPRLYHPQKATRGATSLLLRAPEQSQTWNRGSSRLAPHRKEVPTVFAPLPCHSPRSNTELVYQNGWMCKRSSGRPATIPARSCVGDPPSAASYSRKRCLGSTSQTCPRFVQWRLGLRASPQERFARRPKTLPHSVWPVSCRCYPPIPIYVR